MVISIRGPQPWPHQPLVLSGGAAPGLSSGAMSAHPTVCAIASRDFIPLVPGLTVPTCTCSVQSTLAPLVPGCVTAFQPYSPMAPFGSTRQHGQDRCGALWSPSSSLAGPLG